MKENNIMIDLFIDAIIRALSDECFYEVVDEKILNETGLSSEDVKLPKIATTNSAGADFFAPYEFTLQPGEEVTVPTGIKAHCHKWTVLNIMPKSGLGFKYYTRLANTIGLIDGDYYNNPKNDGCIFVKVRNEGEKAFTIKKGESFCQGVFNVYIPDREYHNSNHENRNGGLGSTEAKAE